MSVYMSIHRHEYVFELDTSTGSQISNSESCQNFSKIQHCVIQPEKGDKTDHIQTGCSVWMTNTSCYALFSTDTANSGQPG